MTAKRARHYFMGSPIHGQTPSPGVARGAVNGRSWSPLVSITTRADITVSTDQLITARRG